MPSSYPWRRRRTVGTSFVVATHSTREGLACGAGTSRTDSDAQLACSGADDGRPTGWSGSGSEPAFARSSGRCQRARRRSDHGLWERESSSTQRSSRNRFELGREVPNTQLSSNLYPTSRRNEWRLAVMNRHGRPCEMSTAAPAEADGPWFRYPCDSRLGVSDAPRTGRRGWSWTRGRRWTRSGRRWLMTWPR